MRCILIYNPAAGRNRHERLARLESAATALRGAGHMVEEVATTGPRDATLVARRTAGSVDAIFACGGDGTVHEVLQGMVREEEPAGAALGIIPLGSANALARHLRLSLDPAQAALQQANGQWREIPVGRVEQNGEVRYFLVMAGAGPDGALACDMSGAHKAKIGRLAYYAHAARLFVTRRFLPFEVELMKNGAPKRCKAVGVMAARVDNLGGLFAGLTDREASIFDARLRLCILQPPALVSLPLWFFLGWLRMTRLHPLLKRVKADKFTCLPIGEAPVHMQVDGEYCGLLPFQASVATRGVRLLVPSALSGRSN